MPTEPADGTTVMPARARVPATLGSPGAWLFWTLAASTGIGTGLCAAALMGLLKTVQDLAWGGPPGATLLDAASADGPLRRVGLLLLAGAVTGLGQVVLTRLSSGNSIDTMAAIWFTAGRLPTLRTLGSAILSILIVGLGASLGREGAPKQAGAVVADVLSERGRLSDEQRRLLVACGAGAGLSAAYGVPLGGALFALEVLRGALSLRLVLPALLTSMLAAAVSWLFLLDEPTYRVPSFGGSASPLLFALLAGPVIGIAAVGFVRAIAWADRSKPRGWRRVAAPVLALTAVGALSIPLPQVLGNGKDVAEISMAGHLALPLLVALVFAKPLAVMICYGSGAPGGLFTPTLSTGALFGALLGQGWLALWPGADLGLFALLGAGALLAATTQGPVSSVVLMMELTGRDRSFIAPLLLAVVGATLVSRSIDPRSVYEARLSDAEVERRLRDRDPRTGAAS